MLLYVFSILLLDLLTPISYYLLGLVRSRDGSRLSPNTQTYISLPSPNIQSAKVQKKLFNLACIPLRIVAKPFLCSTDENRVKYQF